MTAFFYAWYGTPAHDGAWRHWNQLNHQPPDDIASSFYPARGVYSSRDPAVLQAQMADLRAAGIGVVAVSWWGRGSWEDQTLPAVFAAAQTAGIQVAIHIEPYAGRTPGSVVADIHDVVSRFGSSPTLYRAGRATSADPSNRPRPVFYLFDSNLLPATALKAALATLRGTSDDPLLLVQSPRVVSAQRAGADGIYSYDTVNVGPDRFAGMVAECRAANLVCSPSVGPGYDDRQAVPKGQVVDRQHGARYDAMWQAAISSSAEWVSVTSYNEWHEGTQIEGAIDHQAGSRTYTGYEGAWGASGAAAPDAYLQRTAYWIERLPATS